MRAYGWRITDLRYAARGLGERAEGRPVLIRTKDPRYAARYYSFAVGMTKKASQSRDIKNTNKDNGLIVIVLSHGKALSVRISRVSRGVRNEPVHQASSEPSSCYT